MGTCRGGLAVGGSELNEVQGAQRRLAPVRRQMCCALVPMSRFTTSGQLARWLGFARWSPGWQHAIVRASVVLLSIGILGGILVERTRISGRHAAPRIADSSPPTTEGPPPWRYAPKFEQPSWYDELRELNAQIGRWFAALSLMLGAYALSFSTGPMLLQVGELIARAASPGIDATLVPRVLIVVLLVAAGIVLLQSFMMLFDQMWHAIPSYGADQRECRSLLQAKVRACRRVPRWVFAWLFLFAGPWLMLAVELLGQASTVRSAPNNTVFIESAIGIATLLTALRLTVWLPTRRELRFHKTWGPRFERATEVVMVTILLVIWIGMVLGSFGLILLIPGLREPPSLVLGPRTEARDPAS